MSDHIDTNNGNGKKIEHRLTSVEVKLENILTNHLPHIQNKVKEINEKLESQKTWLIGLMGGVIISMGLLIVNLFE